MITYSNEKLVKIIIPIYQTDLDKNESLSLAQCCSILHRYPIVIVKPESLDISDLCRQYPQLGAESFPDDFFRDVESYNRLMLSPIFYERFLDYKYILIYQLDAFVFRDELEFWCKRAYDYIGAPWIPRKRFWKEIRDGFNHFIGKNRRVSQRTIYYRVGNGGFSLRRTRLFFQIADQEKLLIQKYLQPVSQRKYTPEDVFWALEPRRQQYDFSSPGYKEALLFSFDKYPADCYQITKTIPFGCHGWSRSKMLPFWQEYIDTAKK
jgi:hypothetical protein